MGGGGEGDTPNMEEMQSAFARMRLICVTDIVRRDDESDGWIRRGRRYREHVLQDDGGDGKSIISAFVHYGLKKPTNDDV